MGYRDYHRRHTCLRASTMLPQSPAWSMDSAPSLWSQGFHRIIENCNYNQDLSPLETHNENRCSKVRFGDKLSRGVLADHTIAFPKPWRPDIARHPSSAFGTFGEQNEIPEFPRCHRAQPRHEPSPVAPGSPHSGEPDCAGHEAPPRGRLLLPLTPLF
jgi:hypothetical protein